MGEFYEEKSINNRNIANRYSSCNLLTDNDTGEMLLSTREIRNIPVDRSDIYHRVESHETQRLDKLAYMYYKNPQLWWLIAQANGIIDPFEEIPAGTLIRVPSQESLYSKIIALK